MIRFKFWEPVYFRNWTDKAGKVVIHPGLFMGFTWIVGYPIISKVPWGNPYPHKWNIIFHRGVLVLRSLTETGYNSVLAPKSDAYFPSVQVECVPPIKTVPSEHQGTLGPPDISIAEGGGKRRKPSSSPSSGINHDGSDRPAIGSNKAEVDGPGAADGFPAL